MILMDAGSRGDEGGGDAGGGLRARECIFVVGRGVFLNFLVKRQTEPSKTTSWKLYDVKFYSIN
jgi:hypothetical protein